MIDDGTLLLLLAADDTVATSNQIILGAISALALVLAPVLTALVSNRGKKLQGLNAPVSVPVPVPDTGGPTALDSGGNGGRRLPEPEYLNLPLTVMALNRVVGDQALQLTENEKIRNEQVREIEALKLKASSVDSFKQQAEQLEEGKRWYSDLVQQILQWGIWAPGPPPRTPPAEWARFTNLDSREGGPH